MKRLLLALVSLAFIASANSRNAHGGAHGPLPLGINLEQLFYYSTEIPFINVMKSGGVSSSSGYQAGWVTQTSGSFETNEEAYLNVDSDGYPTTLTVSPAPPGGQIFTKISTLLNFNMGSAAPGASTVYPSGQYRLRFEGKGTISITDDASVQSGDTCGAGVTLSNSAANTYVSCTFTVLTPSAGMILSITAITSGTDYPRDISVMQQSNASAYDGGAIFNPLFTAMLAPFSSIRSMEWKNTNQEFSGATANATVSSGATSLTLSSAWPVPSGVYPVVFIDGEQRNATFTLGATSMTWSGGLANTLSSASNWIWGSQTYFNTFFVANHTWANRAKPSNAFWDNQQNADGVPLEIIVALCNQIHTNCHLNVPIMYSDSDIAAMGQLVMSGTGMQSGFVGLTSPQTATFELSNETWNCGAAFIQCDVEASLGGFAWPAQPSGGGNVSWQRNWNGMRTAQMAIDLQTAVGATLFARVLPTIGGQMAGTTSVTDALTTAYWSGGPASAAPIKNIAIAPYWGGNPSSADCTTMTGVTTPLDDFFATLTGQTGTAANGSHTYTSIPSGGWFGLANTGIAPYAALVAPGGTYPALKLIAYEGGDGFNACFNSGLCGGSGTTCTGWPALVTSAEHDPRMGAAYTSQQNWWASNVGKSQSNVFNIFQDTGVIGIQGSFGLLESIMQPISPLLSAPARYIGAAAFVQ